ncbi:MAG TPA: phosphate ABC transporter substrate-binding protein PstS family protein [Actinomycetota bacterium]|nr:phosphate ABC transporter substrate-binding protein PstS family protein [Actinomycetota bacterium]
MSMSRAASIVVAGLSVLAVLGAACSSGDNAGSGSGTPALSGSVAVSGSSTVQPISSLVAEEFSSANPDVQISVDGPGTSDGFVLFCKGETDINDASRAIEPEEKQACKQNGISWVELAVGYDGITVMTNPDNSAVTCLNTGDLYALFGPESQGFKTWSDADTLDKEVDGTGNLPDLPLQITAPGQESGTYDAFIDLAGIEDTALDRGLAEDKAAALRPDYQASANDNVIIQAMEGDPGALGFVGFAYAEQAASQIDILQVDGGTGCVAPSRETIADHSYPLSRTLYIYVNEAQIAENPALKAYVDFYMGDEGIVSAVQQVGYVDLPTDQIETSRVAWSKASA